MGLEDFSSSSEQVYTKVTALSLPGAEEVNESYAAIGSLVSMEAELRRINIWKSFEKSDFFKYCQNYVNAAVQIARTIKKGKPVMIQSPKGMTGHLGDSTTNVLTSLTQLLVDPYYRTYEGFLALIEKEWTMYFTYHFTPPNGPSSNAIFVLFLNTVWTAHNLKPEAFEFDLSLLEYIQSSLHSSRYHDFIFANRYERWHLSQLGEEIDGVESEEEDFDVYKESRKRHTEPDSPPSSSSVTPIPSPLSSLPTSPSDSTPNTPTSTPPATPHSKSNPASARTHVSSSRTRGLVGFSLIRALIRKKKKVNSSFFHPLFTSVVFECSFYGSHIRGSFDSSFSPIATKSQYTHFAAAFGFT